MSIAVTDSVQTNPERHSQGNENPSALNKPALLGLSTSIVVAILTPILIPHLGHPSLIFHGILHLASLSIATFLSIVSVAAFSRARSARLLFMTLSFAALATVELFYLLDAAEVFAGISFPLAELNIELPHIMMLVMLSLFALGVVRVNNR
jgi:hypothetical protein